MLDNRDEEIKTRASFESTEYLQLIVVGVAYICTAIVDPEVSVSGVECKILIIFSACILSPR